MSSQSESILPQFFKCSFNGCSRVFRRKDRLETHLRVHTGERPFVCQFEGCNKSYARSQHLSRHIEHAHTSKSKNLTKAKISCSMCNQELANVYSLQKHVKALHDNPCGPKQYVCPEPNCGQTFHKRRQLVNHKFAEHTEHLLEARKCHRCPHEGCDKVFTWLNLLKRHMKVHQGYTCDSDGCGKSFPNWSSLRKHVAQDHAKVYSCEECGIQFSRKPNLTQHMKRKHQGPMQSFACTFPECGRVYSYRSNLALHIRESHEGEEIWKNRRRRPKPAKTGVKKPAKKLSLAAKLCGLDDRGEVLKIARKRGSSKTVETVTSNTRYISCMSELSQSQAKAEVTENINNNCVEFTPQLDRNTADTKEQNDKSSSPHIEHNTMCMKDQLPNSDDQTVFSDLMTQPRDECTQLKDITVDAEDAGFTELTVLIKHKDRIEKTVVAIKTSVDTTQGYLP